jgi:plasmid stabilization system protein ParE
MERIKNIVNALDVLAGSPMVGRIVGTERRELVIGRDVRGYVALYRFDSALDSVFIMAVRAQREVGYALEESGSAI